MKRLLLLINSTTLTSAVSAHCRYFCFCGILIAVTGCQTLPEKNSETDQTRQAERTSGDPSTRVSAPGVEAADINAAWRDRAVRAPATDRIVSQAAERGAIDVLPPRPTTSDAPRRSFQFDQTPIAAVLNEIVIAFGGSFVAPANEQIFVTTRMEGVTSLADALRILNVALGQQGFEARQRGDTVEVSRTGTPQTGISSLALATRDQDATASTVIYQAQAAPAQRLRELVEPLLPEGSVRLTNQESGLLGLQGDPVQIEQALRILRAADVDWLATVGYRIYRPAYRQATELSTSLVSVATRSGVELVASEEAGLVTLFSRNEEGLDRFVRLLQQSDIERSTRLNDHTLYYEAKHVGAVQLANTIATVLGGRVQSVETADQTNVTPDTVSETGLGLRIAVDPQAGVIIATGSQEELRRCEDILVRMDRPAKQVAIEVTVAEVQLRDEFQFGVQWDLVDGLFDFQFFDNTTGQATSRFPGASLAYADTDILVVLNALDSKTDIDVISSPRIVALNNEEASIQVGSEVPIITQSAVGVSDPGAPIVNATTYRDTGIILTVTPRIRAGGLVEIDLVQEVSAVADSVSVGTDSPSFTQRKIETTLAVPDRATLAIGGLFNVNSSRGRLGVPLISRLPVIGRAFESRDDLETRTELVVLLRPQILDAFSPPLLLSEQLALAMSRLRPDWNANAD